jgi:hypothetical protein
VELENIFWDIDDFCQEFEKFFNPQALPEKIRKRQQKSKLCLSEIVTIIINFHISGYRNFKDYYTKHVSIYLASEFPNLLSYNRIVPSEAAASPTSTTRTVLFSDSTYSKVGLHRAAASSA